MKKETYEDRNKRITVAIPKTLHERMLRKMRPSGYMTMSDLVRELLRHWVETGMIEVKPID